MSRITNPITSYFKSKETNKSQEEFQMEEMKSKTDDESIDSAKWFKSNGCSQSSISTSTTVRLLTDASSNEHVLSSSSTSTSTSNARDPCHGPALAKEYLLLGPYQPELQFPTVNNRRFRTEWYTLFPSIEYSSTLDRAFCFSCRLVHGSQCDSSFTVNGFSQWKNGPFRFRIHQAADYHKDSFERWKTTVQNLNKNTNVLKSLDHQYSRQASENRIYLQEIFRTIHFLARQGIACKLFC